MKLHLLQKALPGILLAAALATGVSAHEVLYTATLDGSQVVNEDGTTGSGSTATGDLEMQADEDLLIFDVLEFDVEGLHLADLDYTHGPNGTAIHVHLGDGSGGHEKLAAGMHDPIIIDLGWYFREFGTLVDTPTGMHGTVSGILTAIQGSYDLTTATGLTPTQVMTALEDGLAYIQVHSIAHPHGDIRGAITHHDPIPVRQATWSSLKADFR